MSGKKTSSLLALVVATASCTAGSVYVYDPESYFTLHPCLMLAGLAFMSAAIAVMRHSRQYWLHMLLQVVAVAAIGASFVVMWQTKESKGRAHFYTLEASWHAMGGGAVGAMLLLTVLGAMLTIPPWGKTLDYAAGRQHKTFTRLLTIAFVAVLLSGWYKLYADDAVAMYGMAGACVLVLLLLGTATLPSSGKVDKGKLQ